MILCSPTLDKVFHFQRKLISNQEELENFGGFILVGNLLEYIFSVKERKGLAQQII